MTTDAPDVVSVVRALSGANVQFVVVGERAGSEPLRLVVSRHPANLEALGRALDRLGSTVRDPAPATAGEERATAAPRRVGDALGTIPVRTSSGDVDLLLGGPRHSLYAEVAARAEERAIDGVRVQWVAEVASLEPAPRVTSRMLGRRLLSLAEGLSHLIERQEEPAAAEAEGETDAEAEGSPGA